MNKLVRPDLQVAGFENWWDEVDVLGRRSLVWALLECASQAGVDDALCQKALDATRQRGRDPCLDHALRALSVRTGLEFALLLRRIEGASSDELRGVFKFAYTIFALAEGRVFRNETPESCNHWWHRDLLDPVVEADLLADPEFFLTSMRTDTTLRKRRN